MQENRNKRRCTIKTANHLCTGNNNFPRHKYKKNNILLLLWHLRLLWFLLLHLHAIYQPWENFWLILHQHNTRNSNYGAYQQQQQQQNLIPLSGLRSIPASTKFSNINQKQRKRTYCESSFSSPNKESHLQKFKNAPIPKQYCNPETRSIFQLVRPMHLVQISYCKILFGPYDSCIGHIHCPIIMLAQNKHCFQDSCVFFFWSDRIHVLGIYKVVLVLVWES